MARASYCCFLHPKAEYALREQSDVCPDCGKAFGFPLWESPTAIREFRIASAIDRGFYGATYEAVHGNLDEQVVLKVIPVAIYEFFGKQFDQECRDHRDVAKGTEHLVGIRDYFDSDVVFGAESIRCHIAVLEYIEGEPLSEFIEKAKEYTAEEIAQITIDLFRLMLELENKQRFHNDLHARNILLQRLDSRSQRAEAVDPSLRAVAVDLGSISDKSKSDPHQARLGDIHAIVRSVLSLRDKLLREPNETSDVDYRLAALLDEIAHSLAPEAVGQRPPSYRELIEAIERGYHHASSPWEAQPPLRRINDAYNAQTLHPWFVPRLFVDPDDEWLSQVSIRGPQVIVGIRGCGKTILLRTLQFHSRAAAHGVAPDGTEANANDVAEALEHDGFVGLYVSCNRLLDGLNFAKGVVHEPQTKLFLAYAREGLRAARHLRAIDPRPSPPMFWRAIAECTESYVTGAGSLVGLGSDLNVEREILRMLVSLDRGETKYSMTANPAVAFPALAEAVIACSPRWSKSMVLFLLDDVSTRHIKEESIEDLLGTLLFSDPQCAFKITTEFQTLELALRSPGLIERARAGRDYETFDLGAAVSDRLNRRGAEFVLDILSQRARAVTNHPQSSPRELLGDCSLEEISRRIASTDENSPEKKRIYHGVTALATLCVGDIGDVLTIYESMLRHHRDNRIPIPANVQSECFQDYCSRRLYHLHRRGEDLKNVALSFAEAGHELLLKSAEDAKSGGRKRLRQYNSIYVRLTSENTRAEFEKLRDLTDAGVFVLKGGTETPRTKTRDSDPVQQFVLTYRKLFGLSSYIGLATADRYELSGKDLREWLLGDPSKGKELLLRKLGGPLPEDEATREPEPPGDKTNTTVEPQQFELFPTKESPLEGSAVRSNTAMLSRMPRIRRLKATEPELATIDAAIFGLGFEDRTLESVRRVLETIGRIDEAILVSYPDRGFGDAIEGAVRARASSVRLVNYSDWQDESVALSGRNVLVDVTGLTKSLLFASVRANLSAQGSVYVAHTEAEQHYPLDNEIKQVLSHKRNSDPYKQLEAAAGIWSGEQKPYTFERRLRSGADDSRARLLCAAASPKHERLLSLLDERQFDHVDIIVPASRTPRSQLARLAADVAVKGIESHRIERIKSDDLGTMVEFIGSLFEDFYLSAGFDIEMALTGSKLHAVACAAASSVFRVAQCWYVRPAGFDPARFSKGVGETRYFALTREGDQQS